MYSRILVPTDGSAFSDTVCAHGVAIAEAMGSFVSFLFVMDTLMAYRDGLTSTADAREVLTAQGRTTLDRALSVAMAARVRAAGELIEGSPVDVILRRAGGLRACRHGEPQEELREALDDGLGFACRLHADHTSHARRAVWP